MDNKIAFGVIAVVFLLSVFATAVYYNIADQNAAEKQVNDAVNQAVAKVTSDKDAKISELQTKIDSQVPVIPITEPTTIALVSSEGYLIDNILLNSAVSDTFSDREVKTLFDGQYAFGDNDYDAEEVLTLTNVISKANEEDFAGNPYLLLPENSISYKVIFENSLNTSKIDGDNTLIFKLLGQSVEVSSWDGNTITLAKGTEYQIDEGQSVVIDGQTVTILMVLEDGISVKVGDETAKILEGNMKKVNGLEIYCKSSFYSAKASTTNVAVILAGEDVSQTVSDGDEFAKDSVWDYSITSNSIGVVLNDDFTDLNEDNNKALAKDEKLCLPNNYVCVVFNGFSQETSDEYSFRTDTRSGLDYAVVRGSFQSGLNDYDRIYINSSGIYDLDLVYIGKSVELDDSDVNLVLNGTMIIDNIQIPLNITAITVGTTSISYKENDYLTDYGILIKSPENYLDDNIVKITVPKEKIESSITLK